MNECLLDITALCQVFWFCTAHNAVYDHKSESESIYLYCPTNGEIYLAQQQMDSSIFFKKTITIVKII